MIFPEHTHFREPTIRHTVEPLDTEKGLRITPLRLQLQDETVILQYMYSASAVGAPRRYEGRREVVLQREEWVRVMFNGRFSWEGDWSYRKQVFNIGWTAEVKRNLFLAEPKRLISDMADLW